MLVHWPGKRVRFIPTSSKSDADPDSSGAAFCSTYGSSKFAVRALTQVAGEARISTFEVVLIMSRTACEWGKHGITVNGYAPGFTDTPLSEHLINICQLG